MDDMSPPTEAGILSLLKVQADTCRTFVVGTTVDSSSRFSEKMRKLRAQAFVARPGDGSFWRPRGPIVEPANLWTNDVELAGMLDKHADRVFRQGSGLDGSEYVDAARCKAQFVETVLKGMSRRLQRRVPDLSRCKPRKRVIPCRTLRLSILLRISAKRSVRSFSR